MPRTGVAPEALQFGAKVGSVLEAQVAIFFHRAPDDFVELETQVRIEKAWRDGFAIQDGFEHDAGSVAAKGKNAGGHFVKNYAKRKQIGARVEFLATDLLGGHVGDGANGAARAGQELVGGDGGKAGVATERFGDFG